MIPAVKRGLVIAALLLPGLASCGSSTTKTVTQFTTPTSTKTPAHSKTTATSTGTAHTTGQTTSAPASTPATPPPTSAGPVYFEGVGGGPQQRPRTLELTGDGTLFVSGVQWNSWGGQSATGTGNAEFHGCTPNCAEAPVHMALVSVDMSIIRTCSGRRYYSAVTLTLNSGAQLDKSFMQRSWSPC